METMSGGGNGSLALFAISTEGVVLGVGLFVLTLAMMASIWFLMKAIATEPFTFYTFPGRLYSYRITEETNTRLVVSNTFSAFIMWPLGFLIFGALLGILVAALMTTHLWLFSLSVINFWLWWTYLFCVGQQFEFDGPAGTLTVKASWMGIPIIGSRRVLPLNFVVRCLLESRTRVEKGWLTPYFVVELELREPLEGTIFITKKKASIPSFCAKGQTQLIIGAEMGR